MRFFGLMVEILALQGLWYLYPFKNGEYYKCVFLDSWSKYLLFKDSDICTPLKMASIINAFRKYSMCICQDLNDKQKTDKRTRSTVSTVSFCSRDKTANCTLRYLITNTNTYIYIHYLTFRCLMSTIVDVPHS